MILIIIILTLVLSSFPVHAQEFSVYKENPVLTKVETSTAVAQPSLLKIDNIFSLWFTDAVGGVYRISNMKSANGIDWYDKKILQLSNNPVLTDPFMFQDNNEFKLYYASHTNGGYAIWSAAPSADGVTYSLGQEHKILAPSQSWEGANLSCPSVIKDQSLYYLFYAASGTGNWAVGMATSSNGINWQKCPNNPITLSSAGPHIVKFNNRFYLYSHSGPGIQIQETSVLNGCNTVWSAPQATAAHFNDPSPIQVGSDIWVYGSSNTAAGQTIYLAGSAPIAKPTYPIVIVPGMFSSWNKEALLHNNPVPSDAWIINPNVSEYEAISRTLENKGRILNSNYYIFPYDWRKPIEESSNDLSTFISNRIWNDNPYQPIQIIGHSLGGVVTRIFTDKNPKKPIKQIVTAGAPHRGAVQAYKPLVAGEIDRENSLMWLAQKLILNLNKGILQSDKDTMAQKFPVLFDILPTFAFLKDGLGTNIPSSLINSLLSRFPILTLPAQFHMGGSGKDTPGGYVLGARNAVDILFGNYADGHPVSSWKEDGDEVALLKSSNNQVMPVPIQNHGELIYSKESIKTILGKLNVPVLDSDIPEGKATQIFPAILTFIQSPAAMELIYNGVTTSESGGMIHVQNTANGAYMLRITGQSTGEYTAIIWLIGETDDKWYQFKKQTVPGQTDEYTISFDELSGGTAQEYIAPSPIPTLTPAPTPTTIPTPIPTLTLPLTPTSANSQSSSSSSLPSSSSSNSSSQASQSTQEQGIYPPKKDYLATSSFTPTTSDTLQNFPRIPKVLGANAKNKNEQKKSRNLYVAVIFSLLVAILTLLTYWRKIIIKWVLSIWKKVTDFISTK